MKVILLKSVPKVGQKNDVVEVTQGYAQNALFPKQLAIPATTEALERIARQRQNAQAEKQIQHTLLDKAIQSLKDNILHIKARSNEKGILFSKLHESDIAQALDAATRASIDPRCIKLPDGPIKQKGTYEIPIVDGEYKANLLVIVE